MRTFRLGTIGILFTAILLSVNTNIFAQRGYGQGAGNGQTYFCNNIPNLTADQQTKINGLRTAHWKEMQIYRNQFAGKRVSLQTLRSADNVDMNAINKTIDEINLIQTSVLKNREQHFQNVRNVLTVDQRVYFDNFNRGNGYGQGYGMGYKCGRGKGYGRGYGRCGRNW